MTEPFYTRNEEQVAARALMAHRAQPDRVRYIQRWTERSAEEAQALLDHAAERRDAQQAATRGFVNVMSDIGDDMAKTTIGIQLVMAAGILLFAVFLGRQEQWFLAVVSVGVSIGMLWSAWSAQGRRKQRAERKKAAEETAE